MRCDTFTTAGVLDQLGKVCFRPDPDYTVPGLYCELSGDDCVSTGRQDGGDCCERAIQRSARTVSQFVSSPAV